MKKRLVRPAFQRAPDPAAGLLVPALLAAHQPEQVQRVGVARSQFKKLPVAALGLRELAALVGRAGRGKEPLDVGAAGTHPNLAFFPRARPEKRERRKTGN